jgi:hypothetical protein
MEPGRYRATGVVEVKEFGEFPSGKYAKVENPNGGWAWIRDDMFDFEPVLPEEPEAGTVVIDCDGDAWQSEGWGCWSLARGDNEDYSEVPWSKVNEYGPLKVVYTP